jgi:predicted DNA-binding protein
MKRTTIFVPEELERDLQLYANRDGRPAASLVREALAEYVARRRDEHALPSFAGRFASGHTDTAERHDELLFKTLEPHGEAFTTKRRKRKGLPPARRR